MRAREKALEATEAAAAAAAEKRQAEVEMNLSASERLAALHQTYIAKIAAPSTNAADAVASGASTPRGGGGWRSPPPQTPTRAALRAEAETNARRSVATAEEAQGRLKERRASYQAERLDERERVRGTSPDTPRPTAHRHHPLHLRLHARLPAPSHHRWRASSASCAPSSRRWRRRRSTRRRTRRRRAPSSSRSRRRRRRARRRPSSRTI